MGGGGSDQEECSQNAVAGENGIVSETVAVAVVPSGWREFSDIDLSEAGETDVEHQQAEQAPAETPLPPPALLRPASTAKAFSRSLLHNMRAALRGDPLPLAIGDVAHSSGSDQDGECEDVFSDDELAMCTFTEAVVPAAQAASIDLESPLVVALSCVVTCVSGTAMS